MTASRALNDSGYVSQTVRERVERAAQMLDYRPNILARQLRGSRIKAIGILLPDITNPFFAGLVSGIMPVFRAAKYAGFIAPVIHGAGEEASAIHSFIDHRIDGLIVATRGSRSIEAMLRRFTAHGTAMVTIGRAKPLAATDNVTADHYQGAFDATSYLIALGHRRIGFIGAQPVGRPKLRRYQGYLAALQAAKIPSNPAYTVGTAAGLSLSTEADGHAGLLQLLQLRRPPTAILARNDYTAIGALRAAHESGLKVPADIAIAGFDNIPVSAYQTPPLTTVEQPINEQGAIAANILLGRIEGTLQSQRQAITLPCKLIIRDSTGAFS